MTHELFVTSLSGASARQAVVEETPSSGWLFMTAPGGEDPISDCFLYNTDDASASEHDPPPLPSEFASPYKVHVPIKEEDVRIVWSPKGDAVAVSIRGEFVGFIGSHDLRGYSRSVSADCEWAHPFDVELFHELFEIP